MPNPPQSPLGHHALQRHLVELCEGAALRHLRLHLGTYWRRNVADTCIHTIQYIIIYHISYIIYQIIYHISYIIYIYIISISIMCL